jgi:hypothetical protein
LDQTGAILFDLPTFVTVKGGEYLFVPGIILFLVALQPVLAGPPRLQRSLSSLKSTLRVKVRTDR